MDDLINLAAAVLTAPPPVLAMLLGLSAIALAAFAIYVVHMSHRKDRQ